MKVKMESVSPSNIKWKGFVISLCILPPSDVLRSIGILYAPVFGASENGAGGGGGGIPGGIPAPGPGPPAAAATLAASTAATLVALAAATLAASAAANLTDLAAATLAASAAAALAAGDSGLTAIVYLNYVIILLRVVKGFPIKQR